MMFNRRDFPDFVTEAAFIRERRGPPPMSAEESNARNAEKRERHTQIIAAYDRGDSLAAIARHVPGVTAYRIRQIVAAANFSRRFPDRSAVAGFLRSLTHSLCGECRNAYLSGPWRNWVFGRTLTFPTPPQCAHRR
jgi:hypothetical protein